MGLISRVSSRTYRKNTELIKPPSLENEPNGEYGRDGVRG